MPRQKVKGRANSTAAKANGTSRSKNNHTQKENGREISNQQDLRISEKWFPGAFSISTVGVMFWRKENFKLGDANDAFLQMTGFPREEALGKSWQDFTPPEFHAISLKALDELSARGEISPFEKQYYRKDGSRWWGLFNGRDVGDYAIEFVIDITGRKEAEQQLMVSEQRFRTIAEAAPAIVWVCSAPDGKNIFFSDKWYEFTGQSHEQASGYGWTKAAHPEDWERIAPYWDRCQKTGEIYQGEIRYHRQNGEWRWFNFRAMPLRNSSGTIESWYGLSIDIHDRKIAEEALLKSKELLAKELQDAKQLQQISNRIIEEGDIQELYEAIVESAVGLMHAHTASLQILDPIKNELHLQAYKNFHPQSANAWRIISADSGTACGQALVKGERIMMDNIENPAFGVSKKDIDAYRLSQINSVQSTLLISRTGKFLGVLSTHWKENHYPSKDDFNLFDVLARQAADLIERKQAEEVLQNKQKHLAKELDDTKQLQLISTKIIEQSNIDELYEAILNAATEIMNSDCASIQTMIQDKEELYLLAYKNFHPTSVKHWEYVKADSHSSCGLALIKGERVIIPDIENHPFDDVDYKAYRMSGIVAIQSTPLTSRSGKLVGMISTHWKKVCTPSDEKLNLFDVLARQAADLIERRQSEEELKKFNMELEQQVKQRTEELNEKNKQLQLTVSQLESFNYIASHDLQEPLRKIQTFVELLNEFEISEPEMEEYIRGINVSSGRMSDLINSLLQYSRLSRAMDAFQFVDLNQILEHVKTDYEIPIREKNATMVSADLPTIRAIPFQMHQLFANLISNSLKFCERQPEINISSRIIPGSEVKTEEEPDVKKNYAELVLRDNGIGFDNKYNKKIFEVFQRLHNKSDYSGTGIGLSIVDKIVKQHNGFIKAEGENGIGSVFTVYLPIE
ncbi:MAG: hypothetical protein C5B52_01580 [Bacteroidetes bacterium]|nr:MAG: hypothetical protein C5B52_01580 [Bacteroidota bacterium]